MHSLCFPEASSLYAIKCDWNLFTYTFPVPWFVMNAKLVVFADAKQPGDGNQLLYFPVPVLKDIIE